MRHLRLLGCSLLAAGSLWITACDDDPAEGKVKAAVTEKVTATKTNSDQAVSYPFNAKGSSLDFVGAKVTAKHEGSFKDFSGTVELVEGSPEKSSVSVEIDMTSVAIEPSKLEAHLKSPDFFDVEKYPKASFQSTSVKAGGAGDATHTVTGNLTLHGTTRSISFPASIKVGKEYVRVEAEFAINRKDFGIVYPGMPDDLIKDDVLIQLELDARTRLD